MSSPYDTGLNPNRAHDTPLMPRTFLRRATSIMEDAERNARQGVPLQEEMVVRDPDTMQPVPWDSETIGEIMFRGNIATKGYLKSPAVLYVAVVARPDDKWGETLCAFAELKTGAGKIHKFVRREQAKSRDAIR